MMEIFMAARTSIRKFFEKRGVDGQAVIEYALILVLVALVVIVVLGNVGQSVNARFGDVDAALNSAPVGS